MMDSGGTGAGRGSGAAAWLKILAAQHPNGYRQTAFTLADMAPAGRPRPDGML